MHKLIIIFLFITSFLNAQNSNSFKADRYLEDQIYIGLSYITILNSPEGVSQNGFSNGLALGFVKDLPLNEKGNLAFGIGLGYGRNTYFQNIKISRPDLITIFEILEDGEFKNNKFSSHNIEFPIEFRWRTSTLEKYKFWRIYTGAKISYSFYNNAKLRQDPNTIKISGISEITNWQYGLTLAVGYGTWNFNFYYGLTDLFSDAYLGESTPIKINDFRIGLIFYIL
ncbi:MAG: PorT family protein [Flavobacteriaceae bacterium]|nr:PorT family protein [Flavobacteriaceae bacterium]